MKLIRQEPVMFAALVNAVLVMLLAFGVSLTLEQIAAVVAVVELLIGLIVRAAVTPVKPLEDLLKQETWRDMQARHESEAHRHIHTRVLERTWRPGDPDVLPPVDQ